MAEITVPIKVELPENWQDEIIERMKAEGDLVIVTRCKDCQAADWIPNTDRCYCLIHGNYWNANDFCSYAERQEECD